MLICTISAFSQIPAYYNDVNLNQSSTALKDALAIKIISTHTTNLSYTPGVWDALKQSDLDPTDSSKVLLIYGWDDTDSDITNDRTRGKDVNGGGTGVWNREHVFSKSLANPNLGTSGPGADAHNLRPCDAQRNSSRSNRKFEDGSGNSGITASGNWYPGDEWKGDVARMMMYMYLRYGNQTLPTGVAVGTVNATDSNMINLFLEWNAEDPVSALEMQRNPVLENLQGNRNPFIDNPAFATQIWGGPQAEDFFGGTGSNDTLAPTAPTNLVASNTTQTNVTLTWQASTDDTAVAGYTVFNGTTQVATTSNTAFNVTGLMAGTSYSFSVKAFDLAANVSSSSNIVSITTTPGGTGNGIATELLISEYVEGSSNNKALEIANFTGATVDLAAYSLKKATNGGGTFSNTISLSGNLANGQVYVIAHGSATTAILNVADLTNSGVMTFNGNDAVGLFKNDILIDLLGNANSSANFAQNITLQRKSSITSPNTTYTVAEWDSLATDTFSGLGSHSIDGGSSLDTTAPTTPTNLISSNISQNTLDLVWSASTDNTAVTGYDVYQNGVKLTTVTNTAYTVSGLVDDTAYNFYVIAFDAAANVSSSSNTVFITTLPIPDTTAPTAPSSLASSNITQTSVDLNWTASTDNVAVSSYDVYQDNVIVTSISSTNYSISNLIAATSYNFYIRAKDDAGNISTASNTLNITTESASTNGTTTDLLISEYVEGSSNNKAIEIANFTGNTVDLSSYSLKKATNGSGSFSSVLNLSGSLADQQVYVIANTNANATILNVADITNGSVLTFNGNDAVGLFKNDVLIDLIGDASNSAVFAQDVTLQRKSSVTSPNSSYTITEWDSLPQDTFSGLGNHFINGGVLPDTTPPSAPSNLVVSNVTQTTLDLNWSLSTDNIAVVDYDVFNGSTIIGTVSANNFSVSNLTENTTYSFSIVAKDAAGNSTTSSTISETTLPIPTNSTTILSESYFESGWDNWTDGGNDVARYSGSRSFEESYSIRIRDNSGTASAITSSNYDLSPFDTVEVEFHFYAYSMENNEDFWLRYFNGNTWETLATYASGTDFNNNNFYSAIVTLDATSYIFANNSQFRFQNDASGNADHIYIDQVVITGKTGSIAVRSRVTASSVTFIRSLNTSIFENFEDDFILYPNPVSGSFINIKTQNSGSENISFKIINTLGQVVSKGILKENAIDVNSLGRGIYIVELNDGDKKMIKKFVKN